MDRNHFLCKIEAKNWSLSYNVRQEWQQFTDLVYQMKEFFRNELTFNIGILVISMPGLIYFWECRVGRIWQNVTDHKKSFVFFRENS